MPDFRLECGLGLPAGARVAGVDEVGRGPLAGPVTAAAVVLDPASRHRHRWLAIDDSKLLSPARRAALAADLRDTVPFALGWAEREEIDRVNILQASMLAMRRAVDGLAARLGSTPDFVLVDGNRLPPLDCPARAVIRGDRRSLTIAAASILAKVARDARMAELADMHPGYGWERNAGYGTAEHLDALRRVGPCVQHRRGFAPVRAAIRARGGLDTTPSGV